VRAAAAAFLGTLTAVRAVWDSSIVLARYLEHRAAAVAGKRVLDLSAGTGLVGER